METKLGLEVNKELGLQFCFVITNIIAFIQLYFQPVNKTAYFISVYKVDDFTLRRQHVTTVPMR